MNLCLPNLNLFVCLFLWLLVQQKKILKLKGWLLCTNKCEWAGWLDRSKGRSWTQCGVDMGHREHTLQYQGVLKGCLFRAMSTIGKLLHLCHDWGGQTGAVPGEVWGLHRGSLQSLNVVLWASLCSSMGKGEDQGKVKLY